MKNKILYLIIFFLTTGANATTFLFQDNTFSHSLRCCNATDCIVLKDIEYISNDTLVSFNAKSLTGVISCYEIGNKLDQNLTDIVVSNPNSLVLVLVTFLFIIAVIGFAWKKVSK